MVPGTSRLKNQGPGFEPGPRSYFSWIAEISESHASHIMRRALLRTKTSAPPPFSRLSAGATIHALYAVSLGTTGRGDRTWYPFQPTQARLDWLRWAIFAGAMHRRRINLV